MSACNVCVCDLEFYAFPRRVPSSFSPSPCPCRLLACKDIGGIWLVGDYTKKNMATNLFELKFFYKHAISAMLFFCALNDRKQSNETDLCS